MTSTSHFDFTCPSCEKTRKARYEDAGKRSRCICGELVVIPTLLENALTEESEESVPDNSARQSTTNEQSTVHGGLFWFAILIGFFGLLFAVIIVGGSVQDWHRNLPADTRELVNWTSVGLVLILLSAAISKAIVGGSFLDAIGRVLGLIFYCVLALLLFALFLTAAFGTKGRYPYRPLNWCAGCGYTWFPRGHDWSVSCPRCGRPSG